MIREIVMDTETTGLSPQDGHRVVEIGALELINHVPSGKSFHVYLNPERPMPKEAEAVHGLSDSFLRDKPLFRAVAEDFLTFIADSLLVIHNASFDVGFLNAELARISAPPLDMGRVLDTLQIAKQKHPMAPNSLDALCKRYGVDLSKRTKHGALLDSELLADVYLELIGGRQTALGLQATVSSKTTIRATRTSTQAALKRTVPLPGRLTPDEADAHAKLILELGEGALWLKP